MAAPTITAVGTAYVSPNNATNPMTVTGGTMPTHQTGDVLLMFAFFDTGATTSAQTLSTPAGWTSLGVDADNLTHGMLFHVYFKYAASAAETFTSPSFAGGTTGTTGASGIARVMTLRPSGGAVFRSTVSAADLVANSGTATFITTAAQNITSVGGFTPDESDTLICVYGGKRDDWTSVATLSGDSLTWTEQIDSFTTSGADAGMVVDTAPQTTAAAITAKTFTVTGGATEKSCGRMFALSQTAIVATLTRSAAVDITPAVAAAGHEGFLASDIPGLYAHYDANQLGLANDDPVSSWTDMSGGGRHLTGTAPTFKTNIQNGLPGVLFDGTNDTLAVAVAADTTRTIFVVASETETTSRTVLSFNDTLARLTTTATTGGWFWNRQEVSGTGTVGGSGFDADVVSLVLASDSSLTTYVDGVLGATFDPHNSVSTSTTFRLGAIVSTNFWRGYVYEVIVYDSALGTTERQGVEAYLSDKWIPVVAVGTVLNTDTAKFAGTLGAEPSTSTYDGATVGAITNLEDYP